MTSFTAKNLSGLKLNIKLKKTQILGMNMPFISSREARKKYSICGFATHEICIFASLDEIKGIFIPKI